MKQFTIFYGREKKFYCKGDDCREAISIFRTRVGDRLITDIEEISFQESLKPVDNFFPDFDIRPSVIGGVI